jgi:hypothetical protein
MGTSFLIFMSPDRREHYPLPKPGETRNLPPSSYVWLQGLLRYTRDIIIGHNVPGDVPNMPPVFCGVTSGYRPGELTLLFSSYDHTDHSQEFFQKLAHNPRANNVAMQVINTASPEISLMMRGRAEPVAREDEPRAIEAFNKIRRLKNEPEIESIKAKNDEDTDRRFWAVTINDAWTQGERWSQSGKHIGEGHPKVDIQRLLGFENLPGIKKGHPIPRTKKELFNWLFLQDYKGNVSPITELRVSSKGQLPD